MKISLSFVKHSLILASVFIVFVSLGNSWAQEGGFFDEDYVEGGVFDEPEQAEKKSKIQKEYEPQIPEEAKTQEPTSPEVDPNSPEALSIIERAKEAVGGVSGRKIQQQLNERYDVKETEQVKPPKGETVEDSLSLAPEKARQATISLVASIEPTNHALRLLREVFDAKKNRGLTIGRLLFIDSTGKGEAALSSSSGFKELMVEAPSIPVDIPGGIRVPKHLKGQVPDFKPRVFTFGFGVEKSLPENLRGFDSSPLWIVRYDGKDHYFSGNYSLSRMFTSDGRFQGYQYPLADGAKAEGQALPKSDTLIPFVSESNVPAVIHEKKPSLVKFSEFD